MRSCCNPRVLKNKGIGGPEPRYLKIGPGEARQRIKTAFLEVYRVLRALGAPVGGQPRLELCQDVRRDRERGNLRAYFHVGHRGDWTICHDRTAGRLPDTHLYGLVLHEFGHPLAMKLYGKSRQEDADRAIYDLTGIPILYRTGWVVQWITRADVRAIQKHGGTR